MAGRTARVASMFLWAAKEAVDIVGAVALVAGAVVVLGGPAGVAALHTAWGAAAGLVTKGIAFAAANLNAGYSSAMGLNWWSPALG